MPGFATGAGRVDAVAPGPDLDAGPRVVVAADDGCRAVVLALAVEGNVEVRRPAAVVAGGARLGLLVFEVMPETGLLPAAAAVGVPVRDVAVLEVPFVPSCFVGDFTGERRPLTVLAAGVGVDWIVLALRPAPVSCCSVCLLAAPFGAPAMLLGLPLTGAPLLVVLGFGLGSSRICFMPEARQKMP